MPRTQPPITENSKKRYELLLTNLDPTDHFSHLEVTTQDKYDSLLAMG